MFKKKASPQVKNQVAPVEPANIPVSINISTGIKNDTKKGVVLLKVDDKNIDLSPIAAMQIAIAQLEAGVNAQNDERLLSFIETLIKAGNLLGKTALDILQAWQEFKYQVVVKEREEIGKQLELMNQVK